MLFIRRQYRLKLDGWRINKRVRTHIEYAIHAFDKFGYRAPVCIQCIEFIAGIFLGLGVSKNIATPETIDGLLRVTDHDHRGIVFSIVREPCHIDSAKNAVLNIVSVLELVDHRDGEIAAQVLRQYSARVIVKTV